MRALIEHSRRAGAAYDVVKVLSDQPAAAGLAVARDLGVPAQALGEADSADRAALERALTVAIGESSPSLIVLAGFLRILSPPFVIRFAGKILNIHPSLLPKFPGLHTHRRALQANESQHGATVHFVTEELDGGPPVIQARVAVSAQDDEASLAARVQAVEHRIYPLAVQWFCEDRLRYDGGRAWLDGRILRGPVLFTETPP
ncbi:MAG: phosphoribosylglycinamide formyltransferase [Steroidobacteraceae bacterium]